MAATINLIIDGVRIPISAIGKLKGHDGWGHAPITGYSESGALQDGDTDRGYRLNPRIGKFVFNIAETELEDMYVQRDAILDYFSPDSIIQVEWIVGAVTRVIDCKYRQDMEMPWDVNKWAAPNVVIPLKCSDPCFYDPIGKAKVFVIGGGADKMEVPTVIPMVIGASTVNVYDSIIVGGNYKTFPKIRITGPITNPVITHVSLGKKLDFTGFTVAAAHYYDIDLRYGYKTIVDNHGTNKLSELSADSDLTTFHLGANRELVGGINSIHVTGTAATPSTGIEFTWFDRYTGR